MVRSEKALCEAIERAFDGSAPCWPEGVEILVTAFCELSAARSIGPNGHNPIAYSEVMSWSVLNRIPLEPHHVRALKAMDRVWLERANALAKAHASGVKVAPRGSGAKLNPEMFDML